MSEDANGPDAAEGGDREPDDFEMGEPIHALRDLEFDTSHFFLRGIRRRIHRRTTATQLLSVSWELPGIVLSELASMFVHVVNGKRTKKES
ncbi:MAG TPA: hypothetical protein VHD76_02065 [Bryobacteraceae bacterium]|jgi:hypothetical protein|nr:hypothetical protein [Bryobacteraceae bacterium]